MSNGQTDKPYFKVKVITKGVVVFQMINCLLAHENWCPNFDALVKNKKNIKSEIAYLNLKQPQYTFILSFTYKQPFKSLISLKV